MDEIDPTRSTDPRVKRGTFVGMAAGAVTAAATSIASAQDEFGKPHPPIVPEDDPAISVQQVELRRPDGGISAYYAQPRDTRADTPGVVLVMHIWGVDQSMRDAARRFAKAGFAAMVPNLYARLGAPSGDGVSDIQVFRPYAQKLQPAQVDGDLRAAALWLQTAHPRGKVAVGGFCMGGAIALRQAVVNDDVFAADAVWYGNVANVDASKVRIPIVGSYGERDTSIPPDTVRAFRKALRGPNDIVIYPTAGHAFFDDQRASYVEPAAVDSWKRAIAFLTKYLKS
jgi:carboxymethylenebutenolidase